MTNPEIFNEKGYCVVKNVISDELRDFVTQYALFDEMQNFDGEGDIQVRGAYKSYANPAMETMLIHLHKTVEENSGLTLHPTYSYYRVYRNGDALMPHYDREACEISATMCFNYSYDDKHFLWPIYVNGGKIDLYRGDMAIYKGFELQHWREPLRCDDENVWHVQAFFHYVNANGPYADYKFDKRESIGMKKEMESSRTIPTKPDYITFME